MPTISTLSVDVVSNTSRLRVGLAAAGTALTVLGGAAIFAFKQFEDSEKITAQTGAVLKSTGNAAHVTAQDVTDLATALMKKTAIDDEAIRSGENLLLTFTNIRNEVGRGNDIFNQATKVVTDMSVALGTDMKSAAIQVGKALQDPTVGLTALRRVGVSFNDTQSALIEKLFATGHVLEAQKLILAELTKEFGGSAEAQKTASATISTSFNELAETIGGLLAPLIGGLVVGLTSVVDFLKAHVGPALRAAQDWFAGVWESIGPVVTILGRSLLDAALKIWRVFEENIVPSLKKLWEAIQPLLPILGALAAAILIIASKVLPVLFEVMSKWIVILADVVDFVRTKFIDPIIGFFQKLADRIRPIVDAIIGVIRGIVDVLMDVIHAVQTAISWLIKLGGAGTQVGDVGPRGMVGGSGLQHGGIVTSPQFRLIGEAGPEAVIPLDRLNGMGVTVNIGTLVGGNITEVARALRDELNKLGARNATTGFTRP